MQNKRRVFCSQSYSHGGDFGVPGGGGEIGNDQVTSDGGSLSAQGCEMERFHVVASVSDRDDHSHYMNLSE